MSCANNFSPTLWTAANEACCPPLPCHFMLGTHVVFPNISGRGRTASRMGESCPHSASSSPLATWHVGRLCRKHQFRRLTQWWRFHPRRCWSAKCPPRTHNQPLCSMRAGPPILPTTPPLCQRAANEVRAAASRPLSRIGCK